MMSISFLQQPFQCFLTLRLNTKILIWSACISKSPLCLCFFQYLLFPFVSSFFSSTKTFYIYVYNIYTIIYNIMYNIIFSWHAWLVTKKAITSHKQEMWAQYYKLLWKSSAVVNVEGKGLATGKKGKYYKSFSFSPRTVTPPTPSN